jgi:hypothetical protein
VRTPSTTASDFDSRSVAAAWARTVASSSHFAFLLGSLCASFLALALAAAPASADRTYDSQISGFTNPWGLAVDSADNAWISDPGNGGRIFQYNAYPSQTLESTQTGGGHYGPTYIESFGVNSVNGYLYVGDSGPETVDVFDPVNFVEVWGVGGGYVHVTVDNSGNLASKGRVYVSKSSGGIMAFSPDHNPINFSASAPYISGNTITGTPGGAFGQGWNIAVDDNGNIYVVDKEKKVVDEFDSTGAFLRSFDGTGAPGGFSGNLAGVAVDPTTGNVLVVDAGNHAVDEFSPSGEYLSQLLGAETPALSFGTLNGGIAVNSSGYVYVADGSNHVIDIFTPGVVQPKITYGAISNSGHTSGTLNATVDPNGGGEVTGCHFEYGTSTTYSSGSAPCLDGSNATVGTPGNQIIGTTVVHADLSGLTAETTYHYRLVASNAEPFGTKKGSEQLYTPKAVIGVTTEPASNPVAGSETLGGSFTGEGIETTYYFEYVPDSAYDPLAINPYASGSTTAAPPGALAGSGTGPQTVSATVSVSSFTEYHYRAVFTNSFGTTYGPDQAFVSAAPLLPTVGATSASEVSSVGATLAASVDPGFGTTVVRFDYGTSPAYGSRSYPTGSIGSDGAYHPASAEITDLTPRTTYHFRALATNWTGTTHGPDQEFTTPDVPLVGNEIQISAGTNSARISADIRPGFRPTTFRVEYGRTSLYGSTTSESPSVGADDSAHRVEVGLDGLDPETTYLFRVVAMNSVGNTVGTDAVLTTGKPRSDAAPPITHCRKGMVRRGGHCVKKRRSRRHLHRRRRRVAGSKDRSSHAG